MDSEWRLKKGCFLGRTWGCWRDFATNPSNAELWKFPGNFDYLKGLQASRNPLSF
jgi:hypothetical protein